MIGFHICNESSQVGIGEEDVPIIIASGIEDGTIEYRKPQSDKNMTRDLFAHAALLRAGVTGIIVLEEVRGQANIDLSIRTECWEVKSPQSDGRRKDPGKVVQDNLARARHQFRKHPLADESQTRVVFNGRYTEVPDDVISERIEREILKQAILEVVQVRKDGTIVLHGAAKS